MLRTQCLVLLSITLGNGDRTIIVGVPEQVVGNIAHAAKPATTIQQRLKTRLDARPNLDSCAIT